MLQNLIITLLSWYIRGLFFLNKSASLTLVYKFFSTPNKGKYKFKNLPKSLTHFSFKYIGHTPLFYSENPKANRSVLLIHGWNSNAARWAPLIDYINSDDFNIYLLEAPGHGCHKLQAFSIPAYAADIIKLNKLYHFNVMIGHSIGGTALFYALHQSEFNQLNKIISLGAPSDLRIMIDNFYDILKLSKNIRQAFDQNLEHQFQIQINDFCVPNFTKNIQIPVFLSHAKQDKVVLIEEAYKIYENLNNPTAFWLQNADHSMHQEALYSKINAFLNLA